MRNRSVRRTCVCIVAFVLVLALFFCHFNGDISISPTDESSSLHSNGLQLSSNSTINPCLDLLIRNGNLKSKVDVLLAEVKSLKRNLDKLQHLERLLISQDLAVGKTPLTEDNFLNSFHPSNEFEVVPFDTLSGTGLYGGSTSVAKKPAAYPFGRGKHEWDEVKRFAVRSLNDDVEGLVEPVNVDQIHTAITRTDKLLGTVYDMYFTTSLPNIFRRIKIARPFSSLKLLGKPESLDENKELIHFVMALSGRLAKLKEFLNNFVSIAIETDNQAYLTIVYFYSFKNETLQVNYLLQNAFKPFSFNAYNVIFVNGTFSRGTGLQRGIESWKRGNVLTFLCDVDIYFSHKFLDRCRFHTSPGKKLYYPIVFSLYNPRIVFGDFENVSPHRQLQVKDDYGFWRDFGFGMACFYKQDFLDVTSFDHTIKGWGMEDAKVYRSFIKSNLTMVRAFEPGLYHLYHGKMCDGSLPYQQFLSCLHSKSISEGSHKHMGMLAFGHYLLQNESPDWAALLQEYLNSENK